MEACRQLADKLVEAWNYHGKPADLPETVENVVVARRLVAQRCLYGVDKNPFAVNLARLSLWLVTLAKDLPFTFLDHALKCGDSLVGLTRAEIGSFGTSAAYEPTFFEDHKRLMKQSATKALAFRQQIQTSDTRSDGDAEAKQALLQDVDRALEPARLTAKVAIASFFAGDNAKQRQKYREEFGGKLIGYEKGLIDESEIQSIAAKLTTGTKPVQPFNWELEFPEVFKRENPGFDAIVGNPPFLGGTKISTSYGTDYLNWLHGFYEGAGNRMDFVAYFFRRGFSLLRLSGSLGLIATNTIGQGDTRAGGLAQIRKKGGWLYEVTRRHRWPGLAAVVVSIIHLRKGERSPNPSLNKKSVPEINSYLFHTSSDEEPTPLIANKGLCFEGSKPYGQGFLFDDSDTKATPIAEMQRLIEHNPQNAECIFPYIGGEEVNSSPTHSPHRFTINFGEMTEQEAFRWPDLMKILQEKVKSERAQKAKDVAAWPWWRYWRSRAELYKAAQKLDYVLVISRISTQYVIAVMNSKMVFSERLDVFTLPWAAGLTLLQSRIHEIWARFWGSSMKDDLLYTPSTCFETFPFPRDWETNPTLESAGKAYYEFRADLMIRHNEGLTATYNRFHDPDETNPDILKLRELHAQMDRAVLAAYGWQDIPTDCEFLLDYEDEDDEGTSKRKKPWRYRWPEEVHDEVLARLLKLNQERAEEEKLGRTPRRKVTAKTKTSNRASAPAYDDLPLFNSAEGTTNA